MDDRNIEKYTKEICDSENENRWIVPNNTDFAEINNLVNKADLYFRLNTYSANEAWQKIKDRIEPKKNKRIIKLLNNRTIRFAAASVLLVLLVSTGYFVFNWSIGDNKTIILSASDNVIENFELPDGTLVSLNSNSKLFYPSKFEENMREVAIEGEAFFDVKHDKESPFVINAGKAQVKVLGTSFNVNAYPSNKMVEVIVETGKVELRNKMTQMEQLENIVLSAGDKGTLVLLNNSLEKTSNSDPNFMAWKSRNLVFKSNNLKYVFDKIEKTYHVDIKVNDPIIEDLLLTAQFNNYSLDFIFKIIENTFSIEINESEGSYIVGKK